MLFYLIHFAMCARYVGGGKVQKGKKMKCRIATEIVWHKVKRI